MRARQTRRSESRGGGGLRNIFIGPNGIRAGWRLLIFLAIVFVLFFIAGTIVRAVFPGVAALAHRPRPKVLYPATVGFELAIFVVTVIAAAVMAKIERRKFRDYGLPFAGAVQGRFWRGALWGFLAITAVLLVIFLGSGFRISGIATHGAQLAVAFLAWTVAFLFVGLAEEFTFRGYPQFTLTTGIGFWPAALVLSLGFAAAHLGNPGENALGVGQVALFGLVFCFVLLRTGNLWFGIGFHAAWDWAETFFYGVRDSGMLPWHPFLKTAFSGPAWLTGGNAGPEGSVVTIVALLVTALLAARAYPRVAYRTETSIAAAQ